MKSKIILLFAIVITGFASVYAQNDAQMSHYMFNNIAYNPAFAGANGLINATFLHRTQWTGFKNAPSTQFLAGDMTLGRLGGAGISIINDKLGYEKALNIRLMYAYKFQISEDFDIFAGLGLGILNKTLDGDKLIYESMTDDNAIKTKESEITPNIDFGLATKFKDLTLGLSFSHVSQSIDNATFSKPPRHFYAFASYEIGLNEKIDVVPSVYFKNSSFISQFELSALGVYDKKFWGGLSYRMQESLVIMAGVSIMNGIKIGYSYDLNTGPVKSYSSGSHEIMLAASFKRPEKAQIPYRTPRIFN